MATPAARPNYQQYTAGSCTLEIEVQPSALSQWSAKPIAKELSFQLWLNDGADNSEAVANRESDGVEESRRLVAEGDRTDLQGLSQYFQQQTQSVLAIATINGSRSAAASSPPQSLHITKPLGYLQLCDVTSVLSQYEQITRTLPVALGVALSSTPSAETASETARKASVDNSNVIPLAAARRQRSLVTDISPDSRQRNRRRRTSVWASSAAAALFAVGLTTTLLSRDPSLQESNVASDAVPEAQGEGSLLEESQPQAAKPPTSQDSQDADATSSNTTQPPSATRQPDPSSDQADAVLPDTEERPPTNTQRPQATTNPPRQPVGRAPVADSDADTAKRPDTQPPEAPNETEGPERDPALETPPPPPPVPANSERPVDSESIETPQQEEAALSAPTVEPEPVEPESAAPTTDAAEDSDSSIQRPQARIERAAPEPFIPPSGQQAPSSTASGSSRGSIFTPPGASSEAELSGTVPPGIEITIEQVKTYFQQRWQNSESAQLSYQLQLNAAGEVVSFIGLDEASQTERDRILPADMPPTFEPSPVSEDGIVLRVQLLPDGTVEVTPF